MTDNLIGSSVWYAAALPATNDAAGFEALTWVQIKGVQEAFEFGVSHGNTAIPDLQEGFTSGTKGMGEGMDSTATFRKVAGDAGQTAVKAASDNAQGTGSVKVVKRGSGPANAPAAGDDVEYAQGYYHSYKNNRAGEGTHEGFAVNFKQNALTVEATEPV